MVLHDWSDAEAFRLLASTKAAAPAGARLITFELVVPDGAEPHVAKMIDLTMLGMLNGRERTQAEYRLLLEQAGFEFGGVTAKPSHPSRKSGPWPDRDIPAGPRFPPAAPLLEGTPYHGRTSSRGCAPRYGRYGCRGRHPAPNDGRPQIRQALGAHCSTVVAYST